MWSILKLEATRKDFKERKWKEETTPKASRRRIFMEKGDSVAKKRITLVQMGGMDA